MEIKRSGSRASLKAPAQYFTGNVRIDPLFEPPDPCIPTILAWNFVVNYDARSGKKSTLVYELLLTAMSDLSCHATVTSITSGAPQPLISIQPSTN